MGHENRHNERYGYTGWHFLGDVLSCGGELLFYSVRGVIYGVHAGAEGLVAVLELLCMMGI